MQHDLAAWRARLTPRRPAIFFRDRWYDYAALDLRARRLAGALAGLGIGKGDRVGILAANHLAHFDLMLAAPKLGFVPVAFNYRLSDAEQSAAIGHLQPRLLLHDAARQHQAATAPSGLDLSAYESWLSEASDLAPRDAVVGDEDVAMIQFTGGSTGTPKGAMLPYRQIFYNAVNTLMGWGVSESDCVVLATPAFHAAVNALAMPLLHAGGRVVIQENFEPGEYLSLVQAHGASLLFMVPTMFQMLAEHPDFADADLSGVRWAISGGAPCPEPVRQPYVEHGVRFRQGYGMTEAGVNCFSISLDDAERHPGSVGYPMPHARAVVRDEAGQPVPAGETGELTLAGPHLFLGYFEQPEATAACLRNGWLWTGDLARQDEQGRFTISGRRKEMFISGGENIYPVEIETALYAQPEIAEAAVLGVPDERWGEIGLAALVLRADAALNEADLRERLRVHLAGYKLPRVILFLDALPKSGAGKILKPEIRRLYESQRSLACA